MADKPISAPPEGLEEFIAAAPTPGVSPTPTPGASPVVPEGLEEFISPEVKEEKYGTGAQRIKAGLEGVASAATFGLSTGVERALGVNPEDIQGRAEANPGTRIAGQAAGLVGSSLIPVAGAANLLTKAGAGAAKLVGLAAAESTAAKIGSMAVKGAVENALFQSGEEVSKMLAKDHPQFAETALADIGLASIIGGGISGAIGSANPLWKATLGGKTEGILKTITDRLGGIEGSIPDTVQTALEKTGLADSIAPEIRASLSDDPFIRNLASTLEQTDTNASGHAYQEAARNFRQSVSDAQASALNIDPVSPPTKGSIDRYTTGRNIGEALSSEIDAQISPLAKGYEVLRAKFQGANLEPSLAERVETGAKAEDKAFAELQKSQKELMKAMKSNDPGAAIEAQGRAYEAQDALAAVQRANKTPGTVDTLVDKISSAAEREGWTSSPSSEIMREVSRVTKELPNIKNLKQLSQYIQQVGENTASTLPFGQQTPVSRAGMIIKGILRDAEGELLGRHIGSEAGEEALVNYTKLRQDYAAAAKLKDEVSATLGLKASTSGYAKALKAMAASDGETILNRLSGVKDAAWLDLLQQKFPGTAKLVKDYHVQNLAAAANSEGKISSAKLIKAMDGMSPQLRQFAVGPEAEGKIKAAHSILEQMNDRNHNFSNTARTGDKLMGGVAASAVGIIAGAASHSGTLGLLAAALTKTLGKDIPDAARLGLLKFLGSSSKVDADGFKAMVDVINHTIKGENLISKATKNVFKAGQEVLPQTMMPKESDIKKLDKRLEELKTNPAPMMDTGGKTGYYLPEQGTALARVASTSVEYLNSLRPPVIKANPLDTAAKPDPIKQSNYVRALQIAQQPMSIIPLIKEGTIRPQDITTIKTIYPNLYDRMVDKLVSSMTDAVERQEHIPYKTRMGLSMFMGKPLDSTMTPEGIMAAQMAHHMPTSQQQTATQPAQGQKHSTTALNKLPGSYMTASQARQQRQDKS